MKSVTIGLGGAASSPRQGDLEGPCKGLGTIRMSESEFLT